MQEENKQEKARKWGLAFQKKYTVIAIYAFAVIALSILLVFFCLNVSVVLSFVNRVLAILSPVVYALVITYLMNPLVSWFERRVFAFLVKKKPRYQLRRALSIAAAFVLMLLVLGVFLYIVLPQIVTSTVGLVSSMSSYIVNLESNLREFVSNMGLPQEIIDQVLALVQSAETWFTQIVSLAQQCLPYLYGITVQVTSVFYNLVLGLVISVYTLMSKEKLFARTKKLLYAFFSPSHVDRAIDVTEKCHKIFSGFLSGKLLDSTIIGILCFIGMSILNIPLAVLVSVVVGVTNVIPYFGPFIGAIPSLILIFFVSPIKAVWFGIFLMLLQQFDGNILGPKILGDSIGISAFWVIFAVLVGGGLFGVAGMFLGVPVFAVIYMLASEFIYKRLKKKNLPTDTKEYASEKNKINFW